MVIDGNHLGDPLGAVQKVGEHMQATIACLTPGHTLLLYLTSAPESSLGQVVRGRPWLPLLAACEKTHHLSIRWALCVLRKMGLVWWHNKDVMFL